MGAAVGSVVGTVVGMVVGIVAGSVVTTGSVTVGAVEEALEAVETVVCWVLTVVRIVLGADCRIVPEVPVGSAVATQAANIHTASKRHMEMVHRFTTLNSPWIKFAKYAGRGTKVVNPRLCYAL